ncbi:MAG TPA: glycosyltransferase 87 family protein [Sphingomonadaceae bacterium]
MIARTRPYLPPLPEALLALAVMASFGLAALFFARNGYLPQPFIFDTNDTFMDWFNTSYWANNPGTYDVWRSIYPPLSFVFLNIFSVHDCYLQSPFFARDCDWIGRSAIVVLYMLDVALLWLAFRRNCRRTAIPRTLAFAVGMPLLFTLERGNLILAALAAFILAHGPLVRSPLWRGLANALAINFKPYLVIPSAALALKRKWRALELAGIATVAIYLITLALVGSGSPLALLSNTVNWVQFVSGQVWNEVNYSTSYASLLMLRQAQVPLLEFVPSRVIERIEFVVPLLIRATQVLALAVAAGAWLQPRALTHARLALILIGAYFVSQSPGGYTQVFIVFLVFLEPWQGLAPKLAIVGAYLLSLVGDWPLATVMQLNLESWLSGHPVSPSFGLTVGHFARPGVIILLVWVLGADSLVRVAKAHLEYRPNLGLAPA